MKEEIIEIQLIDLISWKFC